jgi:flagellar export protein FliJ
VSGFTFRLQRLIEWRTFEERQQAALLHQAARLEEEHRQKMEASAAHLESVSQQLTEPEAETAGMLQNYGLIVSAARHQVKAAAQQRERARAARAVEQERFEAARIARRAIERLRELRHAEWILQDRRSDQQATDEVARRISQENRESA